MIAIIIGIIILIFLPLPIKVSVVSFDNRVILSIYNHKIDVMSRVKAARAAKRTELKVKKTIKRNREWLKVNSTTVRNFIRYINCKKFKPTLKLRIDLNYGFDDAAVTGMAYGLFNCASPIFYKAVDILFKVKNYKYNVNPDFNSKKFIYKIEIKSIIFISLANVIYMMFIIWNKFVRLPKTIG